MARVVVVGAGLGGLRTAEALRRSGFDGGIVVVGEEAHLPYSRPPLSKEVLAGGVAHERVAFPLRSVLGEIDWRLGRRVTGLDRPGRAVTLDDGSRIAFDGLVVASGLRPRRLDVPGPPPTATSGRHAVRTLDDAASLRAALGPGVVVVVLGAGFVGCEVAATARRLGCEVTVAAVDAYPLVRPLGEVLGAEMQRRHEANGVAFHLGVGVTGFVGDARVTGVELTDGTVLEADVVVEAIGSHCNTDWLAGSGIDLTDGVLCDGVLRAVGVDGTAVDGIHAVGDVARFPNPMFDDVPRRVEHWNIPTETGRRAGPSLAAFLRGEGYAAAFATSFRPLPSFWSDQYDTSLQSYGAPDLAGSEADDIRVLEGDLRGEVVVGYLRDGVLVGVVGLGMLPRVNAYRPLVGRPFQGVPGSGER